MTVIAMPLESWYDFPLPVAMPARIEATRMPTTSMSSMMARARTVRGGLPLGRVAAEAS
jgi:hypothetical protein